MKKTISVFVFIFISTLLLYSEDILNNTAYISQIGYGENKESAQNNALVALSKFFQMKISICETEKTYLTDNKIENFISEEMFVQSESELFAVHYTKAKYDKKQNLYEVTAYIDRAEAWQIYKPKINDAVYAFEKIYSDANSEKDMFLKLLFFSKAYKNAKENELMKKLDFVQILVPDHTEEFSATRNHLSNIESIIQNTAKKCSIKILCDNDFEDCISKGTGEFFSKIGIIVTEKKYDYICSINIIENQQILSAGTFFSPTFSLAIINSDETVFSLNGKLKKIGAKNEIVAKQRVYQALTEAIQNSLKNELIPF